MLNLERLNFVWNILIMNRYFEVITRVITIPLDFAIPRHRNVNPTLIEPA